MRIAFDVKGTIEGPKKKFVLGLLKYLQEAGHEVVVWSNSYGYAVDAVRDNELDCQPIDKYTYGDSEFKGGPMDLCIDDDSSQTWLGSRRFIWVHNLPEAMGGIKQLADLISAESWPQTGCVTSRWSSGTL